MLQIYVALSLAGRFRLEWRPGSGFAVLIIGRRPSGTVGPSLSRFVLLRCSRPGGKIVITKMHLMNPRSELAGTRSDQAKKQNVRLLIALSLLLIALAIVLIKDRGFWFGSKEAAEPQVAPQIAAKTNVAPTPAAASPAPVSRVATAKHNVTKTPAPPAAAEPSQPAIATAGPTALATNRVVLPPLDVEVVAGDSHRTVHPGSAVTKLEITGDSNRASTVIATMPMNAAERERLSTVSAPELQQTMDYTYPLLSPRSKVQGSVVLQAVIGADGTIENLNVVSGPAILTTAALQAVRQWHFKPYLLAGQPVETKTRITVNFTIRVAENPGTAS